MNYISNIWSAAKTTLQGLRLSLGYLFSARKKRNEEWVGEPTYFDKTDGTFTVQYPKEEIPIPDNGRYKLHNEIDDCIVCDKCAKICPVDCIAIEPIRSPEVYGHTSDGTPLRIHAATFDIDMSKCCFCGLCTVVCPTECLTMTKEFDYSTERISDHNFSFGKLNEQEISEKKKEFELHQEKKNAAKQDSPETQTKNTSSKSGAKPVIKATGKPVFRPRVVMKKANPNTTHSEKGEQNKSGKNKPDDK